jgi:hypothetical protein
MIATRCFVPSDDRLGRHVIPKEDGLRPKILYDLVACTGRSCANHCNYCNHSVNNADLMNGRHTPLILLAISHG